MLSNSGSTPPSGSTDAGGGGGAAAGNGVRIVGGGPAVGAACSFPSPFPLLHHPQRTKNAIIAAKAINSIRIWTSKMAAYSRFQE
ncbi:hypothetical protein T09_9933 [Trichinella sp. T9]|nr:hypothetical protein T09_9933 [Trichinella sp. T9]